MRTLLATDKALRDWVGGLARDDGLEVWAPVRQGAANTAYKRLAPDLDWLLDDYRPSIAPPGKRLSPDQEVLFTFHREVDGGWALRSERDATARVLVGVRSCDLKAITQMDAVNTAGCPDPHYLARRAHTTVIGWNCLSPCDESCFCESTGSLGCRDGADAYVTPLADGFLIEALTQRGDALLAGLAGEACRDGEARRLAAEGARPKPFGRQLRVSADRLPGLLHAAYRSPVYERHAERCYSCGTCNLVCPTCYCFDVCDDLNLDAASGTRTRTWDACMNPGFAAVAGGHNFRNSPAARQRHRVKRKFEYLPQRHGLGSFCVGCGRCGRQCTTGIDIFDIVNDIVAEAEGAA